MDRQNDGLLYFALVIAILGLILSVLAYFGPERMAPARTTVRPAATFQLAMAAPGSSGQRVAARYGTSGRSIADLMRGIARIGT